MKDPTKAQLALAQELGIEVTNEMSGHDVNRAITAADATPSQVQFVTSLFEKRGWPVPGKMTFGQASRILDELAPLVDEQILLDEQWHAGDVLGWRGEHYRIVSVHHNFTFTLERVELKTQDNDREMVVETTKTPKRVHHPFTLSSEDATKVNL